jgi:tartrate dehydrogenase/decarboxylase/D-malate dehydrogenase
MISRKLQVITIPGDGIGQEVIPAAISVLNVAGDKFGFQINWTEVPWGSDYYRKHQRMMPSDGIETMSKFDAILLGAIGVTDISDVETLWGLLIPIRRNFDQYINLRPIKSFKGVRTPLAGEKQIDMLIIRENAEGEYSKVGGRYYEGFAEETALQVSVFTRRGIERVTHYAVEQAKLRKKRIVSATKSNGIIYSMPFWDEVVTSVVEQESEIELKSVLIDALAAALVLHPEEFDVIVASNLFGDILSDLAAALVGSIGIAASANLNPERKFPSMFEPVHGSAPDIMGKGIANPVGAIQAGSLMLRHLGETEAADDIDIALYGLVATGISTTDLGGNETTNSFATKLIAAIVTQNPHI